MAKTITEVARRALVMLGKLPIGQTPTSTQENDLIDAYNQVYSKLEQDKLVTWSSTDDIPDEFVNPIASLIAAERAEGIPNGRYQRLVLRASVATKEIAATINGEYVNPRRYTDY